MTAAGTGTSRANPATAPAAACRAGSGAETGHRAPGPAVMPST